MSNYWRIVTGCERWGLRIWALGMILLILTASFSPAFQWRLLLFEGVPLVAWAGSRFFMRWLIRHVPTVEQLSPLSRASAIRPETVTMFFQLMQIVAAVGFLLVSFWPLLAAFQLWGWPASDIK